MFGRATITLGIGPHSSNICFMTIMQVSLCYLAPPVKNWRILLDKLLLFCCPCAFADGK